MERLMQMRNKYIKFIVCLIWAIFLLVAEVGFIAIGFSIGLENIFGIPASFDVIKGIAAIILSFILFKRWFGDGV